MWNIERLEVYDKICFLVKRVYVLIGMLPKEEKFALGDQMRRAVSSIKLNILEGSGKPRRLSGQPPSEIYPRPASAPRFPHRLPGVEREPDEGPSLDLKQSHRGGDGTHRPAER